MIVRCSIWNQEEKGSVTDLVEVMHRGKRSSSLRCFKLPLEKE